MSDELANTLKELMQRDESDDTCMCLSVSQEGRSVELSLDTGRSYYADWLKGEDGDVCLYRDRVTDEVVGFHLPLLNERLVVNYRGPIKVNEGFRKEEGP